MKWRKVKDAIYEISTTGVVRNGNTGRILKTKLTDGYEVIILRVDGVLRTCRIHRLVAAAFLPNPLNKAEVHHIDGNKINNNVTNLSWSDPYNNKWFSRHITKHSKMLSFKKIETLYNDNKNITLKQFIKLLKKDL
jgi:hypothetical protein